MEELIKAIFNFRTYKKMRLRAIRNIRINYDNDLKHQLLSELRCRVNGRNKSRRSLERYKTDMRVYIK